MEINKGSYNGTEEKDPTEPKSNTSKNMMWTIIIVVVVAITIIGGACFVMHMASHSSANMTVEVENASTQVGHPTTTQPHRTYHYGWINLGASYDETVKVASDKGEHFIIETAGDNVEARELVNRTTEFPPTNHPAMKFSLTDDVPDYSIKGQTFAFAFKAANASSIGKRLVYCIYDDGIKIPEDWRQQATYEMLGIK